MQPDQLPQENKKRIDEIHPLVRDLVEWRQTATHQIATLQEDQREILDRLDSIPDRTDFARLEGGMREIRDVSQNQLSEALRQTPESVALSLQIHKTIWLVLGGVGTLGLLILGIIELAVRHA